MKEKRKAKKPSTSGGLPACNTDEAEGRPVDSGMAHGKLRTVRHGFYVDVVRCDRCEREFRVAAQS